MADVAIRVAMAPVLTAGQAESGLAAAAENSSDGRPETRRWWRTWLARFGLAELFGTVAAVAGFAAGYLPTGSLLTAAATATIGEVIGFYGCIGARTAVAAWQATAHLAGKRRLAAGAWHAVTQQLASCAAAEALDSLLIRPGCMAGAAWLARPLPGGIWLGFMAGKVVADVAWYGMEAVARRGVTRSIAAGKAVTPCLLLDLAVAREGTHEPARPSHCANRHAVRPEILPRCLPEAS